MATIINGKEVSAKVKEQVAEEVKQLKEKGIHPGLAVVIVGEDPASKTYVKNKKLHVRQLEFIRKNMRYRQRPRKKNCWIWYTN